MVRLEICAPTTGSVIAAERGGADRIELCAGLEMGGMTPSPAFIDFALKHFKAEVHVLIRPRPGDFVYSDDEFQIILDDIEMCKRTGVHGIVCGALTSDSMIEKLRLQLMLDTCEDLPFTFHRGIDHTKYVLESTEVLASMGVFRVLSSGGYPDSMQGSAKLKEQVQIAGKRMHIMAGGGINLENLEQIIKQTGVSDIHMSAKQTVFGTRALAASSGSVSKTGAFFESDESIIRQTKGIIDKINNEGWIA